jgi:xylitol oxidase
VAPVGAAGTNWSGNYTYRAGQLQRPHSIDDLRRVVAAGPNLQVRGTRHSFTSIGDAAALIVLDRLDGAAEIVIDRAAMSVSVGPAVTYATLADALNREGLALANLASLPHISVAGAVTTATHGSGDAEGNLATAVIGLQLVTSTGELIDAAPGEDRFEGMVVSLGKLGVVTRVTVSVQPYYELRQHVYEELEWDELFAHFDEITAAGRSVSVFHRLGQRTREVWVKHDGEDKRPDLFGARAARRPHHPVPGADPANCTPQLGRPGPWSERLPHFQAGFTPSSGEEIQSEFFVARTDAIAAIRALLALADEIRPLLLVAELRTIARDSLWLSPHYGRDSVGLHFTWRRLQSDVERVVGLIEAALERFGARPHWGKLFTADAASISTRYERMADFAQLREDLDPRGVFANDWLREHVLGVGHRTA